MARASDAARRWAAPPVLPPRLWTHRHQILRLVLWANVPPTSVLVLLHRQDRASLVLVSLVAGLAVLATLTPGTRVLRATLVSVGLMACAGLAAYASTGPQRFAYFVVMTASIALYRSWPVLAVACVFGIGEELVLGSLGLASVGALFMLIVGSGALIAWSMDVRRYPLEEGPDETQAANRLQRGIHHGELILHYQPKFDLRTRRIVGVEALVRWSPPGQELVFPDAFIGVAERAGIMKPLTFAVLDLALRQYRAWDDRGLTLPMAINLTASILDDNAFPIELGAALQAAFVSPGGIALELTESVVMAKPDRTLHILERLSAMGIQLAIDDFGTGYSSLAYLGRLPVDEIKIDRSFVLKMSTREGDRTIVQASIDLAHKFGKRVVAEGVEDTTTLHLLEEMGCDQAQGYLISRPLPAEHLARWLENWVPPALLAA
ncbi:MAG TPA: EAL domain-containing protein [Candidatus Dormibacteraeota bacterium]|nr:EAL domain-containing protein [Candidatus Dormibacteraeota bacterium]